MNEINKPKDVTEVESKKFENCHLAKQLDNKVEDSKDTNYDSPIVKEVNNAIKNKLDGIQREREVAEELEKKYPSKEGYSIISEAYLRDKNGDIIKDSITGEARRIDFVVIKNDKVVDSIEVTSKTADKTNQIAKEERIRENGGNYIRDYRGNIVEIPSNVHTRIERRD